jgi:hypothetical protein
MRAQAAHDRYQFKLARKDGHRFLSDKVEVKQVWKGFDADADDAFEWADLHTVYKKDKVALLKYLRRLLKQSLKKHRQSNQEARDICKLLGIKPDVVLSTGVADLASVGPETKLDRKRRKIR